MNRSFLLVLFLAISLIGFGQNDDYMEVMGENQKSNWQAKNNLHSHLLPLIPRVDSLSKSISDSAQIIDESDRNKNTLFEIRPLLELGGGVQQNDSSKVLNFAMAGAHFAWRHHKKWYADMTLAGYQNQSPNYIETSQEIGRITPGLGYSGPSNIGYAGLYATGRIGFNANEHFHFELGRDKNFWGDGYRSLILSDNASPYPYFKITTNVWKIRYINLWAQMSDISMGQRLSDARRKFTSVHALSWNISKKINLTLYEMVVWQSEDKLSDRGMDLNYLNPIIFYRPVEFSLGSADNEIVGLSIRVNPTKKTQIYGQFLLDEFLFKEFTARSGWWANKFGLQLGLKKYDFITENLNFQSEFNYVRPFTYTHGSVLQNWGHLNQSLAHPLGTNFIEWNNHLVYQRNDWELSNEFIWAIYGRDTNGDNYGGDLFRSYKNPFKTYDNYMAQGLKSTLHFNKFKLSKRLNTAMPVNLNFSYILRYESNEVFKTTDHMVQLGISINPVRRVWDF